MLTIFTIIALMCLVFGLSTAPILTTLMLFTLMCVSPLIAEVEMSNL